MRIANTAFAIVAISPLAWSAESLLRVDHRGLVSRADLHYDSPASRPEEGMPVGNGRMGSLVWTTPSSLRLQINRSDVHAMDSTTVSFPRADSDYGSACGYVDIHLTDAGDDVFAGNGFRQHLSLYEGLMTAQGNGLSLRAVAWPNGDVMAIEVDDRRPMPSPVRVELRMLRFQSQFEKGRTFPLARNNAVLFRTANHTATSRLQATGGRIALTQEFLEGEFYDSSAVAVAIVGRDVKARYVNESTVGIAAPAGRGKFTILIGSAESPRKQGGVAARALAEVDKAAALGFEGLARETANWWGNFWSRGFVYLNSASGQAAFVESNYTYNLYLMAASSRGDYPPRFGGLLWFTNGDMSRWGSQYWFANTYAYYSNLMPANRLELMDPMFRMYEGMLDAAALAARQQWGSEGVWIPETTFFNGPERLPGDIAAELQDLMLVRKPWTMRSPHFDWFANTKNRHNSRWNFRADGDWQHGYYVFKSKADSDSGAFGHTTHILGVAARIGNLAWQRYRFTGDTVWLRAHAYPFIRGAAEFYRHYPNLRKGSDGIYHIHHTNSGESSWNSQDAAYEVAVMRMIFPLAVKASELLDTDAGLRPLWQDIAAHLPPQPPAQAGAVGSQGGGGRPFGAFVYNGPGAIQPIGPEPELKSRFLGFTRLGSFIDAEGSGGAQIFRNRLRLREGPGAIDAEHIAGLSSGIHSSLLDSSPASLSDSEPARLFNGWPKDWDAAFTLLARGGFLVSAAQLQSAVRFVEVKSQLGGEFSLENPWKTQPVALSRNGTPAGELSGPVLRISIPKDETVTLSPRGQPPSPVTLP